MKTVLINNNYDRIVYVREVQPLECDLENVVYELDRNTGYRAFDNATGIIIGSSKQTLERLIEMVNGLADNFRRFRSTEDYKARVEATKYLRKIEKI